MVLYLYLKKKEKKKEIYIFVQQRCIKLTVTVKNTVSLQFF